MIFELVGLSSLERSDSVNATEEMRLEGSWYTEARASEGSTKEVD